MNNIFISYRRDDSAAICGRIFESLDRNFGHGNVFKDVDSIPMGVPFPQYIASVLQNCSVTLVVIGRHWLDIRAPNGAHRLDNPADNVRLEIETALQQRDMIVIPVLVEGAAMPTAESLPESLRPLVLLNAAQVRNDPDYHSDIRHLQMELQSILLGSPSAETKFQGSYPTCLRAVMGVAETERRYKAPLPTSARRCMTATSTRRMPTFRRITSKRSPAHRTCRRFCRPGAPRPTVQSSAAADF
jgi:hypothetical protein